MDIDKIDALNELASDERYVRWEFRRALAGTPDRHLLTLKVCGDEGATRWLTVSGAQARAVRELLAGSDMDTVKAALDGRLY